ncbi:GntR family transcriptional regulator [Marinobacter sp.]
MHREQRIEGPDKLLNTSTKKAAIYDHILNKLMTGQYRFGEKILVKGLSEETGVSRQPIMSALSNLQERGFVQITAQVGCTVYNPSIQEVSDFYRVFGSNEGLIAALAAERCLDEEKQRLEEINEKIEQINPRSRGVELSYMKLNEEFHNHLHLMARSPLISRQQMANFQLSDFFIVQSCGFQAHIDDATEEHGSIIEAINSGEPDAAQQSANRHIENIARQVLEAMASGRVGG